MIAADAPVARVDGEGVSIVIDPSNLLMGEDAHTFIHENVLDCFPDFDVVAGQNLGSGDESDPASEPQKCLREFQGHVGAAVDNKVFRQLRGGQRLRRSPVGRVGETCYRRNSWRCTGGNQRTIKVDRLFMAILVVHLQCMVISKSCFAMYQLDIGAVFDDGLVLGLSQFVNTRLLVCVEYGEIDVGPSCGNPIIERTGTAHVYDMGSADQDLRGDAADVDAGASCCPPLYHRHLGSFIPQSDCGRKGCGPATNHSDLKRLWFRYGPACRLLQGNSVGAG